MHAAGGYLPLHPWREALLRLCSIGAHLIRHRLLVEKFLVGALPVSRFLKRSCFRPDIFLVGDISARIISVRIISWSGKFRVGYIYVQNPSLICIRYFQFFLYFRCYFLFEIYKGLTNAWSEKFPACTRERHFLHILPSGEKREIAIYIIIYKKKYIHYNTIYIISMYILYIMPLVCCGPNILT